MEYAELVKLVWRKRNSASLQEALEEAALNKEEVRRVQDFESLMEAKDYRKLLR
jgi:hypothetical protein